MIIVAFFWHSSFCMSTQNLTHSDAASRSLSVKLFFYGTFGTGRRSSKRFTGVNSETH